MRPPSPVPVTVDRSMPCSVSNLRTTGESTRPSPDWTEDASGACSGVGAGEGSPVCSVAGSLSAATAAASGPDSGPGGTGAAGAAGGTGAADGAGGATGAAVDADPLPLAEAASPITARVTPTSTVSPSSTRMAVSTPSAGDGTSESTLSVDTSNSGSSRATWSPTALYHLVMVPSVTVSPSCGMVTSGNVEPPSGQGQYRLAERLRQGRVRLDELGHLRRRWPPS